MPNVASTIKVSPECEHHQTKFNANRAANHIVGFCTPGAMLMSLLLAGCRSRPGNGSYHVIGL